VKILWYVILLFTWYIPLVNCIVFRKFYKAARSEYYFEQAKLDLDAARKENEICKTKYPILMVHGIFFRDWQVINYWGRVPNELIRNGAEVYYGKQQSANKVSVSATEVAERIKEVIAETGAEKPEPGTVVKTDKKGIYVACGEDVLVLSQVQLEGKKRMDADAFLRGCHIETGSRFTDKKE